MQAQEDGLGRRHWKEVQKDFKGTEKQFAGTVCRRVCRTSSKVCGMGNVLGWYIGTSTEEQRVNGVSVWETNTLTEAISPLEGERLPWTAVSWGGVSASQADVSEEADKDLGASKTKVSQKWLLVALVDNRQGLLGGDGSILLATHQGLGNPQRARD